MTAKTKWTIAIVGLLAANMAAAVALATAATDGDTQVIPDYYARAVHYDDAIDQAARDRALGWHVAATIAGGEVTVDVHDAAGAPVAGRVHVVGYQRAHAADRIDELLVRSLGGRYRAALHPSRLGMHDLTITVARGNDRFTKRLTIEAR